MPDPFTLSDLKSGSDRAISTWYRLYSPRLHSYFLSKAPEDDAQELVHDTFLSCLESLPLFRGSSSLYTWMLGIARHELADYYRKKYAKKAIAALPFGQDLLDLLASPSKDSSESLLLQGEETRSVLSRLPRAAVELLERKYLDNDSVESIAASLNIPTHAAQGRLYRARLAFKKLALEIIGL